jgi:hypothetical protein
MPAHVPNCADWTEDDLVNARLLFGLDFPPLLNVNMSWALVAPFNVLTREQYRWGCAW